MKKILIPYDFSGNAENTLAYGIQLAKELSADISLFNVIPYPVVTPEIGMPAFSYKEMMHDDLTELQARALKIKKSESSIGTIECFCEMGDITEAIKTHCIQHPVDFVVMGIYHHGNKLMQALMGSNAVDAAHKLKSTVIIVPPDTKYKKPAIIAFAKEQNESGGKAIEKAKTIAHAFGAELQLIHVVEEHHHFTPAEVHADGASPGEPHKLFIVTDKKVSEGLLGMLDNELIDMIMIEPQEHNVFYKFFHESVSKEVAFASPVPVLLIHS